MLAVERWSRTRITLPRVPSDAMPPPEALSAALRDSGATLSPGLNEEELAGIEAKFGFEFAPDHRLILSLALPLGHASWPDWRRAVDADLRGRLAWPHDGILFDVDKNSYWNSAWGERPSRLTDAVEVARTRLAELPPLVPVYGHRYLPTVPSLPGNPVLSCYQTDVIYYGDDLLDWFDYEFHRRSSSSGSRRAIPFWSDVIEGAD
jgi:hypothetical protein